MERKNNSALKLPAIRLLADSGATKCSWAIVELLPDADRPTIEYFETPGINAVTTPPDEIEFHLSNAFSRLSPEALCPEITAVQFYGAGCSGQYSNALRQLISRVSGLDDIVIDSDMTGAAKALFNDGSGIACILGTGSNSCLYLNGKICDNIPPLGWIVGDEGSGAYIGRELINAIYKRRLPDNIRRRFEEYTSMALPDIITRVYRTSLPNQWLGSLMPFIHDNIAEEGIRKIIEESFIAFIDKNLHTYERESLPIGFCGGIAYHFADILRDAMNRRNLLLSQIIRHPITSLAAQAAETLLIEK